MTIEDVIRMTENEQLKWKRFSNMTCVNTRIGNDFRINLCKFQREGEDESIEVYVEDIENDFDVFLNTYSAKSPYFKKLDQMYNKSYNSAEHHWEDVSILNEA